MKLNISTFMTCSQTFLGKVGCNKIIKISLSKKSAPHHVAKSWSNNPVQNYGHPPGYNPVISRGTVRSAASSYAAVRIVAGLRPVLVIV